MSDTGLRGSGASRVPAISFEFFPPKNEAQGAALDETVAALARFRPAYVSVTYGAGGTSQERSLGAVRRMTQGGLVTAAHLTCAGATCEEVGDAIRSFRAMGVDRFVALRGDSPGGLGEPYVAHPGGFKDTAHLVAALKRAGAVEVSVSAYPERHPQSADWEAELDALKRKVDAGADRAITQFFFDNDVFEAYVERVRRAGVWIPVVPGVMPVHRFHAICNFASRCGASVPAGLARRFDGLDPESHTHGLVAAAVAAEQIADLLGRGFDCFHIYTLNRSELAEAICRFCGLVADDERAAA